MTNLFSETMSPEEYATNVDAQKVSVRHRQEGGDHYRKMAIQPWDIIEAHNLDFWSGNVIKYILRRKDNRLEDLKKARHYLDYLIEREENKEV